MDLDTIYNALLDAGYVVCVVGMTFVVSLKNRAVRPDELCTVLNFADNVSYDVDGQTTVVSLS